MKKIWIILLLLSIAYLQLNAKNISYGQVIVGELVNDTADLTLSDSLLSRANDSVNSKRQVKKVYLEKTVKRYNLIFEYNDGSQSSFGLIEKECNGIKYLILKTDGNSTFHDKNKLKDLPDTFYFIHNFIPMIYHYAKEFQEDAKPDCG